MVKVVYNNLYVHKSNVKELLERIQREKVDTFLRNLKYLINNLKEEYTVIKYNQTTGDITVLYAEDWEKANEPEILYSYKLEVKTMEITKHKGRHQIYHNKWQFVSADYKGFNLIQAKKRTQVWNSIPNIKDHKRKIGNKDYWEKLLQRYNIPL